MNSYTTAMEQMAKYYWGMWGASRGFVASTSLRSSWPPAPAAHGGDEQSWEEQAFARDAAGHLGLGGCVWPPRSYTCSFCRREFRSAQALGGHMNVHRRDRARLRQCASPDHDAVQNTQQQPQLQADSPASSYRAVLHSSPKSTGDLDPNYKGQIIISSSTSPSYISAIIKESRNKGFISMPAATAREAAESDDGEEERRKRRRVEDQPPASVVLPFYVRPSASCEREGLAGGGGRVDRDAKVPKMITNPSSSSLHLVDRQEIDLELRLGNGVVLKIHE